MAETIKEAIIRLDAEIKEAILMLDIPKARRLKIQQAGLLRRKNKDAEMPRPYTSGDSK